MASRAAPPADPVEPELLAFVRALARDDARADVAARFSRDGKDHARRDLR